MSVGELGYETPKPSSIKGRVSLADIVNYVDATTSTYSTALIGG
jgi:hypothetical protein